MSHLDALSRQTVTNCVLRAFAVLCFVLVPSLLLGRRVPEICAGLTAGFTIAAVMTMLIAIRRRERIGYASLNEWDEAIAFHGAAILSHLLRQLYS